MADATEFFLRYVAFSNSINPFVKIEDDTICCMQLNVGSVIVPSVRDGKEIVIPITVALGKKL